MSRPRRPCPTLVTGLLAGALFAFAWAAGAAARDNPAPDQGTGSLSLQQFDDRPRSLPPGRSLSRSRALPPVAGPDFALRAPTALVPQARTGQEVSGHVVPFTPRTLTLPDGTSAMVRAVGVRASEASLEIPDDPHIVGWWKGGALAGESSGSVVVAGHVDSRRYGLGVLSHLQNLRMGQVIALGGGEQRLEYQVVSMRLLPQTQIVAHPDLLRQDGPHQLVVLTCGGPFDRSRHRYRDNLVVVARPLTGHSESNTDPNSGSNAEQDAGLVP